MVTPPGFEPGTNGLKVHCSTIELEGLARCVREHYPTLKRDVRATQSGAFFVENQPLLTWFIALVLAIVIAGGAWRLKALSTDGVFAAILLGTTIVGTGGWWTGVALVMFFSTSSVLDRLSARTRLDQARGQRRDWVQVVSNGGVPVLCTIIHAFTGSTAWLIAAFGGIAAATADTWSSEIGRASASNPILITTGKRVPRGTSGAISARGILASVAGALMIGGITLFVPESSIRITLLVMLAGIAGSVLDSLLGATVQERRFCPSCQLATESNPHSCGFPSLIVGGINGFNNDIVNLTCIIFGTLVALVSVIL